MSGKFKEFKPTSWSIDNRTAIYLITIAITILGLLAYINRPKEKFPDVVVPIMFIQTVNFGTSPQDMEDIVTRKIENQLKSISGIKRVTSTSLQDFSAIVVEFRTEMKVEDAKQKVKDAVDRAKSDLPTDLTQDPIVREMDISEVPIMYINLSGDLDLARMKKYAEDLEDRIEGLKEITRVDIVGALDREIQINVDMYKMQAARITMNDINRAVAGENLTISGGNLEMGNMDRALRVVGQFENVSQIENIVVQSMNGAPVYLKDIAVIKDTHADRQSYARLSGKNVITLNVVKKTGENLIASSDKIKAIVDDMKTTSFPDDLKVTITADMSKETRHTLNELINTIVIGFVLVVVILMFFMGVTNAIFVALSVPLSMFIAFMFLPALGFTLNMIVLFSFLLALGIVVDDAIVVIENTHRIFDNGKVPIKIAAKQAASEVFMPVFAGTMTTLAPFVPLAFWTGIIGKFMYFLPITLIITLLASLLVAYIMNPVFAVDFMKPHFYGSDKHLPLLKRYRGAFIACIIMGALGLIFYITGSAGLGNFMMLLILLVILDRLVFTGAIHKFQTKVWPAVQNGYERVLRWSLRGRRPWGLLGGTVAMLIFSFVLTGILKPKVGFFPKGDPNFVNVFIATPIGTNVETTDSLTKVVEAKVKKAIGSDSTIVESLIANVAKSASDPSENDQSVASNKSRIQVAFVEFSQRHGISTASIMNRVREAVQGIPGAQIVVDQERAGPPVGKPINIEISGEKYDQVAKAALSFHQYLNSLSIPGIEELKTDIQKGKPEAIIQIDRERAAREGISTQIIGMELRSALFGFEISEFKEGDEEYPIQLRYQNKDLDALMSMKISYRDMNMGGMVRQVPLSSVASIKFTDSYGGIKRKNYKSVVTISSNVLNGYTANEILPQVVEASRDFTFPDGVEFKLTGEQEDQQETAGFLGGAMLTSVLLILVILVSQFNSISKPLIILAEVVFSIAGVLLGFSIFGMEISIVMTGIGIVALAGIVVRNGIVLVEFMDVLKHERGYKTKRAIIEAGKIRMTPVLLTATATILGLIPLALGFNMNFESLFTQLDPQIHMGGDSVKFWGPLSWTIIFGLTFATFLTLILVPAMYYISYTMKIKSKKLVKKIKGSETQDTIEEELREELV